MSELFWYFALSLLSWSLLLFVWALYLYFFVFAWSDYQFYYPHSLIHVILFLCFSDESSVYSDLLSSINSSAYTKSAVDFAMSAAEVFHFLQKGIIKPKIAKKYKLQEVKNAHKDLESGNMNGSLVIEI